MSRTITITMELTDSEFAATLERIVSKGGVAGTEDDDNSPADPNAPAVNKFGVPHIASVHSGSKKLNADGTWKRLKGVTAEQMEATEKAWMAENAAPVTAPVMAAPVTAPVMAAPVTAPVMAAPVAAPVAPEPLPIPNAAPAPVTLEDLGAAFGALQAKFPTIDQAWIDSLYASVGATVGLIQTDETMRRKVLEKINTYLAQ